MMLVTLFQICTLILQQDEKFTTTPGKAVDIPSHFQHDQARYIFSECHTQQWIQNFLQIGDPKCDNFHQVSSENKQ